LTLPSLDGLRKMAARLPAFVADLRMIPVSYSTNYALGALFGIKLPIDFVLRIPIGAFALKLIRR